MERNTPSTRAMDGTLDLAMEVVDTQINAPMSHAVSLAANRKFGDSRKFKKDKDSKILASTKLRP